MKVTLDEPVAIGGVTWGPGEYETRDLQEPWKSALESLAAKKVAPNVTGEPKRPENTPADTAR